MRVKIVGKGGFLGGRLVLACQRRGWEVVDVDADAIIVCAAKCGGLPFNEASDQDALMHENVRIFMESVAGWNKERLIMIGSSCMYRGDHTSPIGVESVFEGEPYPGNYGYGMAKRLILRMLQASKKTNWAMPILPNLYGPGDRYGARAHVVAAMIEKVCAAKEAGQRQVALLGKGDTVRELLYVDEAADAILNLAAKDWFTGPINLGNYSHPTAMSDLAYSVRLSTDLLVSEHDFTGKQPGQRYKCMATTDGRWLFDRHTWLSDGLKATYDDFLTRRLTKQEAVI